MRKKTWIPVLAVSVVLAVLAFWQSSREAKPPEDASPAESPPSQASVPPGELHVQLTAESGQSLKDCRANLWTRSDRGLSMSPDNRAICQDGAIHMQGLAPGAYRLQVQVKGLELYEHDFLFKAEHGTDLGTVELGPGGVVMGVVTFEGAPIEDAYVRVQGSTSESPVMPEGRFRLSGAPVGELVLEAATPTALHGQVQVQVSADTPAEVEIVLSPQPGSGVLGLRLSQDGEGHRIDAIHPASGAVGQVSVGEVIVSADGKPLTGLQGADLNQVLSGEPGSSITLTLRSGRELSVERVPLGRLQ